MAQDSDLEKTEQPTGRRIEKAREEGDVPRSRELATCTVLLAGGMGLLMMGGRLNQAMLVNMHSNLRISRESAFDFNLLISKISAGILDLLIAFAPLALLLLIVIIGSPALIGGWNVSSKAFMPKFSKLNPINGISNLFSKNSLVELVKAVLKAILVGSVSYMVMAHDFDMILSLSTQPLESSIAQVDGILIKGFLFIVSALVLIAIIDVPYQLWNYNNKLKMTKEEVKQESKESEGNPEIKARIRQQQREMARRRMMAEIPKADVVITNPTHYAVAIKYDDGLMGAPRVIAKGADDIALKIREIASEHQVPTLESPKLARALYAHTELGDEIPQALYAAVAEILAYIFQLRTYKTQGGYYPDVPRALDVPDALDPHFQGANA
ncbi:flagellar type III secretion system protein FlhB [Methylobacillus gramineus]|uniref:flagellar biosynthesis protein FlhB n=1 Tax=Methylobacillus gramineus TaxID=755169 RepID=UPI001CFFD596|nr:flagellar biosynthesis protein FlhB [Methylobacillus gramineus]MCB5183796.1 flagellar type III secretion system protein FlhB [Methylobacillus gramineus]